MPSRASDRDKPVEENADQTLVQKVEALQERVRKMGIVSDGSDDKASLDEAWGKRSKRGNSDRRTIAGDRLLGGTLWLTKVELQDNH